MLNFQLAFVVASALALVQCSRSESGDERTPPAGSPEAPARPTADTRSADDVGAPVVRVPITGMPVFGDAQALVTIVSFTDYECPYCSKADARIEALRAEYGNRLRVVVGSRPLPMHTHAEGAARAFLAAVELGKGEAMHAKLFAKQDSLGDDAYRAAAADVGLDLDAFDRMRKGAKVDASLKLADELSRNLDVQGTPTFFVNGRKLVGARPIEAFRALIDEEMAKAQALVDSGTPRAAVYAKIMQNAPPAPAPKASGTVSDDVAVDVPIDGAPIRGDARAPVTIVLFSDFECPFCVKAEATLKAVQEARPGVVKVVFRQRPLPLHPNARLAARAALAADKQGRFWEYHDALVDHRDALDRASLQKYASETRLALSRFERDLDDPSLDARITEDEKEAARLEVKGTPTAFVNGHRIVGAQPIGTWLAEVDRAVAAKR